MPLCNIPKQINIVKVLWGCKLIVWNENSIAHKSGFELLNKTIYLSEKTMN